MFINYERTTELESLVNAGKNGDGLYVSGQWTETGAPTATAGIYIPGAVLQNTADGDVYVNTGTTAVPVFESVTSIGANGLFSSTIGTVVPMIFPDAPDTRADAGAISIATYYTYLTTTGAAAMTLPDGAILGQIKKLHMTVDGGDATVTPATFDSGTTITFADVGDVIELMWLGSANGGWVGIAAYNIANGDAGPAVA